MMTTTAKKKEITAFRYNGGQVIQKALQKNIVTACISIDYNKNSLYDPTVQKSTVENVIFVDWFETTIKGTLPIDYTEKTVKITDNIYLNDTGKKTKFYNKLYELYYLGEKVALFYDDPVFSVSRRKMYHGIKLENFMLYRSDWLDTYNAVLSELKLKHYQITRLDVCVDGSAGKKILELQTRVINPNVKTIIRKGYLQTCTPSYDKTGKMDRCVYGSNHSDKRAIIYDKLKEMKRAKEGKEYILKAWERNGLNSDTVMRYEMRLRAKKANRYDYNRLNDPIYLASIMRTESKNFVDFCYIGKDTNKHRTHKTGKMDWIEWDKIGGELLPKADAVQVTGVHRAKQVVKSIYYFEYMDGIEFKKDLLQHLIEKYCLSKWVAYNIESWHEEWRREKLLKELPSN